jgi:predicted O-linked N-acetylglucosamine transferase (SPINDLY family)
MNLQAQSILQQAFSYIQQGNFSQAKLVLDYVLKLEPKNFYALHAMGFICGIENNHQEASRYSLRALKIRPDDLEAIINCAKALQELGNDLDSVKHHKKAIILSPNDHEIWLGCGKSLHNLKLYNEAITHYDEALSLKPDYAEGWSNKGLTMHELKCYDMAIAHFDKALSLKPDLAEGWSNKGNSLNELKRFDEAIAHYDKALSLKPDLAECWSNKGNTLNELKRFDEAIAHYDKALSLKPNIDWAFGESLHAKMKICSWSSLADSIALLSRKVMANEKATQPFSLLSLNDDALLHKRSSEIYVQAKYPVNNILGPISKRSGNQKISVGYYSADLHDHAIGYLMAELFELHDKNKFNVIGFSFGPIKNDGMRQRLEKSFDQFIEVGHKSDMDIAQLSRQLNIDIAVDLNGFTQGSRTGIFSYRAAPIQINWLGYPGTTGANYMDYIIADKNLISSGAQQYFSEKIIYLPDSYQVNDRKRPIAEKKFTREELGLPKEGFVFCCFNNNFKILPNTFSSWMKILGSVEESVLWMLEDNHLAAENLRKEAEKLNIDPQRLVFAERMPLPEHLARHREADLFLDTFPYNAHTTASDALWAGLPVLTLTGKSFASCVATSLLNAIGLSELITKNQEEYETLAIELAKSPQKLAAIKKVLAENRLNTPLFDTPLFTKNLETAYVKVIDQYRADAALNHLYIDF